MLRNAVSSPSASLIASVSTSVKNAAVVDAAFEVVDEPGSAELFQVSTDYFRATCDDAQSAQRLALEAVAIAREYRDRGDRERPWSYKGGYDGWSVGSVAYAEAPHGVLVQASGHASDPMVLACLRGDLVVSPSRLDPQVTVDFGRDYPGYARLMAEQADRYRKSGQREGAPFKVHVRVGMGDGDTLEIGSKLSEVYLRLYDKHREAFAKPQRKRVWDGQFPAGTWRFEGQLKDGAAHELYKRFAAAESLSEAVMSNVRSLFADRGVELPIGKETAPVIRELKYKSDVDAMLAWLSRGVAPSLARLIELGYEGEMFAALGLGDRPAVDLSVLLLGRPAVQHE